MSARRGDAVLRSRALQHAQAADVAGSASVDRDDAARRTDVIEGSPTEAVVTVTNNANEVIPTPIAIVGIPGGLEVRHDQLKELVKQQKIAAYEVIGRESRAVLARALKARSASRSR
jgi:hypothetical protein